MFKLCYEKTSNVVKYRVVGTYIHSRMEGEVDTVKLNTQSSQIAESLSKQNETLTGTSKNQENAISSHKIPHF